ncbi:MAG: hypothetical protein KAR79_02175 [Simkaniaceae bacterium]|nr:hypothetical protein [Simkaniaceae bacterium]
MSAISSSGSPGSVLEEEWISSDREQENRAHVFARNFFKNTAIAGAIIMTAALIYWTFDVIIYVITDLFFYVVEEALYSLFT